MSCYHLTTHSGLEPLVLRELSANGFGGHLAEDGAQGYVIVHTEDLEGLKSLKTIHHILKVYERARTDQPWTLETIGKLASAVTFEEFELSPLSSMRVTAKRWDKSLPFTSETIERFTAPLILQKYDNPVDLHDPEYVVRIDVHKEHLLISLQLTRESLSQRPMKPFTPVTALKANIANAMIMLSELGSDKTLLDPFMGSGTILVEARRLYPQLNLMGVDRGEKAFLGTCQNLDFAGIIHHQSSNMELFQTSKTTVDSPEPLAQIFHGDALQMSRYIVPHSVDAIVTDPPYGVRMSKKIQYYEFYLSLLGQSRKVLKIGGYCVIILVKRYAFDDALAKIKGFKEIERFQVRLGEFTTHIVKLKYIGIDQKTIQNA